MSNHTTNPLAPASTRQSRRASLLALGTAVAGTVLGQRQAEAATNPGKRANKRARRRCQRQGAQCQTFFATTVCPIEIDPVACEAAYAGCCEIVSGCKGGEFIECLLENAR